MEQIYNPYLPLWEHIPDGEPHLFGDRVYIYGSHDKAGGKAYCEDHYCVWSAPKDDLERRIAETPAWREAFVKPAGFAALWRERSFELLEGGRWTSGQFDRVVFTGDGDGRRAVVYDFKTNARRRGESDAAFAARLEAMYAGQMAAYRHAVSVLASIPPERVETRILSNLQA